MSMSNPFDMFGTDQDLEQRGVRIDYGAFWFQVARIDAPNSKFSVALRDRLKPYRRAIELGEMDEKVAERISTETFAETAVTAWGSTAHGDGKMVGRNNEALEFSSENVAMVLKGAPDLFKDLLVQARDLTHYRRIAAEEDAGN